MDPASTRPARLFQQLEEAEQELVLRLVLVSGSLKELASLYGVSYPTIRARLDRLIDRLGRLREGETLDPLGEMLAGYVERGQLTLPAAKRIRQLHRRLLAGPDPENR